MKLYLAVLFLFFLYLPPQVFGADYYVSPSGDDTGPGTQAQPWQSIDKVNAWSFTAGDRIFFAGGEIFQGTLAFGADETGTAADPVTVGSWGAGRAVIDGGSLRGVSIYNTAGLVLENLVVRGDWDAGT